MTLDFLFGLAPFVVMGLAFCAWFLSYRLEVQKVSALRGCEMHLGYLVTVNTEIRKGMYSLSDSWDRR